MTPEGWSASKFGELLEGIDAGWSPQCASHPAPPGSWGVLKLSAVTSGTYLESENKELLPTELPRPHLEVRPGDLLLARANGAIDLVGRSVVVRNTRSKLMMSDKILRLRPKSGLAQTDFLSFLLSLPSVRDSIVSVTGGSHMRNISQESLRGVEVCCPPVGEQWKIAAILSSVDEAIASTQAVLDQLGVVKKAMMTELLTRGIPGRHRRFRQTECGVFPEEWVLVPLSSIAASSPNAIVDGPFGSNLKSEHYRVVGVPVIQSGFVTSGEWTPQSYVYVDDSLFAEQRRSAVRSGDIVMAKIGANAGACAMVPRGHPVGILAGNSLKITPGQQCIGQFLLYLLQHEKQAGRLDSIRSTTAQPAMSLRSLKSYTLPLPPIAEQQAIASTIDSVVARIGAERSCLQMLKELKSALSSALLTGELRVTPDEAAP